MSSSKNIDVYINSWQLGLYDERSPIYVPTSAMGVQLVSRMDALWDGTNVDVSHNMTLVRRPGFSRYSSTAFGAGESPLNFFSFRSTTGTIKAMVETGSRVAWFDTTSINTVFTKTATNRGSFLKVGSTLYYCDGNDNDLKKWANGVVSKWGITAPVTAPTLSSIIGTLSPTSGYKYVYVYKNSATGHVSTASPESASTAKQTNKNFTIAGVGSTDPQVDKVEIYRTKDGGANYYWLTTINNVSNWTYTDSTVDDNLNDMIVAPLAMANEPPPSGAHLATFYLGRVWLAVENKVYFGGGASVTNGVPEECFPPANVFPLPSKVTAFVPTSMGLAVFTEEDAYVVLGSDFASFTMKPWQRNFGVKHQNCVAQDGDMLFILASNRQLYQFAGGLTEIGSPIQSRLAAFDPTSVTLALHRDGADEGLFVSNGTDTIYRYSVAMGCWSTPYKPVNGVGVLSSIEVATGTYRLMAGRATGSGYILNRNTAAFVDDGSAYTAWVTIGSIVVAPPRHVVLINSVLLETIPVGSYPTVAVLMNEISGTFVTLPNPVPDPPQLAASTSIKMMRHDLKAAQTPLPQHARHLQVKVSWPAEAFKSELLSVGVTSVGLS